MIPASRARAAAEALMELLDPFVEQLEIAGSLRRRLREVGDIELVGVPKFETVRPAQLSLFDEAEQPARTVPATEQGVARLLADPAVPLFAGTHRGGRGAMGQKWKRLEFRFEFVAGQPVPFPVDLFLTRASSFGLQLALRTGPGDFSKLLVTPVGVGGALPADLRISDGRLWRVVGTLRDTYYTRSAPALPQLDSVPVATEREFFEALGVPWWEPRARDAANLADLLRARHARTETRR